MKVVIDREACVGCGLCVEACPQVFDLDSENKAVSKMDTVPKDIEKACRDAASECPVDAIKCE